MAGAAAPNSFSTPTRGSRGGRTRRAPPPRPVGGANTCAEGVTPLCLVRTCRRLGNTWKRPSDEKLSTFDFVTAGKVAPFNVCLPLTPGAPEFTLTRSAYVAFGHVRWYAPPRSQISGSADDPLGAAAPAMGGWAGNLIARSAVIEAWLAARNALGAEELALSSRRYGYPG
ncbi:hypothetical protein Bbelb_000350 [Branchiostoma belcheri]|nr:hypothetical protein Bbelb_000350 [Branchiostoma belcheri]